MTNEVVFFTSKKRKLMNMPEEDVQKTWITLFNEKKLTELVIRNYWKYTVPNIFAPSPPCNFLRLTYDEDQIQKELFDPLELFMCGGQPSTVYENIQNLDQPPSLCGKVFKTGDPTYGCRDCGMDPTCVLCAECFKSSSHNKHRYKISTSAGGGYCDCGDREAWKNDVFCDKHIKGDVAQTQNKNLLPQVSSDLVERVQFVFGTVLAYSTQLLTLQTTHLPQDLEITATESGIIHENIDTYVTMLYNDETHTYDQVITALEKAIGCSNREAVAYATIIDREGRCMVRCSDFRMCSLAKEVMDRPYGRSSSLKPLKVQVLHTGIIAHQLFAAKLLSWLHKILEIGKAFRQMFTAIICRDNFHLIESIFSADTQMWKSSRIQWHRLFISGMLMDLESKKMFARVFTKHYSKMMKDFIQDDHEHSVCIVSLAVQLFTMPTIAHMLIAEEEVLPRLLTTFLSECEKNLKSGEGPDNGKLSLDPRNRNLNNFRRIQYILYDLKYLLGFKPEVWTTQLRKGFLAGFDKLLYLFSLMQGMDPAIRQVGQHLEFEPEWESAFNLHIKIAYILPLIIEWVISDRDVIIKAFRMLLRKLGKETTVEMRRRFVREVLGYSVSCIEYNVSLSPVSLHLPLTRLLAGIMIQLKNYGLYYNSSEFDVDGKPQPEELMEPVFRVQVMAAQVNAGMWRRNGFSLNNQVYFYHNVRCRQEMYDRDLLLLQQIACMFNANEYIIHLLNRYELISWIKGDYDARVLQTTSEDAQRQTVILAEEFLLNIMCLICERYIIGIGEVTEEECLKKEIIQLLCIDTMPHSILNKSLPENVNHETGIEKVIGEVAMFRKHPDSKGFFELKTEYKHWYNQFFYHYSKEEQSKSEVTQRTKRRSDTSHRTCCPPPVPPPFKEQFTKLVNFLQCDVLLHIMKIVMNRAQSSSRSVSEMMFQVVLHLIVYALYEEERFIAKNDPNFSFTARTRKHGFQRRIDNLMDCPMGAAYKDLLIFASNKYREVLGLTSDVEHVQRRDMRSPQSSSSSTNNAEKKRKADIAAIRKERIMAKMANMQQQFIKNNKVLFKETCEGESSNTEMVVGESEMEISDVPLQERVVVGKNQNALPSPESQYTCILCHQEEIITATSLDMGPSPCVMVLGAHVQRSTVLSRDRQNVKHIEDPDSFDCLVLSPDLCLGVHTTSCGHAMHAQCWQRYFDDVSKKERRKPHRGQNLSFDIEKNEFLCPLCESLCNTALPLLPSLQKKVTKAPIDVNIDDWLTTIQIALDTKLFEIPPEVETPIRPTNVETQIAGPSRCGSQSKSYGRRSMWKTSSPSLRRKAERPSYLQFSFNSLPELAAKLRNTSYICHFADSFMYINSTEQHNLPQFSSLAKEMMHGFASAVYALGLGVSPDDMNARIIHMIMATTAYTIHATEQVQRDAGNALLSSMPKRLLDSLSALVKFSAYIPLRMKTMNELSVARLLSSVLDSSEPQSLCVLEWDSFSLLVSLSLCMPTQFPEAFNIAYGSIQDHFILRLCFYSNILQILLTLQEDMVYCDFDQEEEDISSEMSDEDFLLKLLTNLRHKLNLPVISLNKHKLMIYVKEQCLPFLRCCGLFFHFLTDIKVPEELEAGVWVPESEYICLLRCLGLGLHFRNVFGEVCFSHLLQIWSSHSRLTEVRAKMCPRNWTHINKLVPLPKDYSELINTASQFPCPATIGDDSHTPTMCLICGEVLCSQSYCCRMELPETGYVTRVVGACTYHAHYCGAGTGIYIRVRECRGLMLSGRLKGCYDAPPYLDEYGETDQGLKRGNPLTLDENLYRRLSTKWLSHSIPNQIARTMENVQSIITEWYYF